MRNWCVNFLTYNKGVSHPQMCFWCQFQSRFSIEADMALLPQNHLCHREQNQLICPNVTPDENVSVWLVFKVVFFFSQYWKIMPDLSKYSALYWPWGLVVFQFIQQWKCYTDPSNVSIAGVDKYTQFSCEAHNKKGVTTSREANINIKGKSGSFGGW